MNTYLAARRAGLARLATAEPGAGDRDDWEALWRDYYRLYQQDEQASTAMAVVRDGSAEERVEATLFLYSLLFQHDWTLPRT